MRTLTINSKSGETDKAVQYCIRFWIVEAPHNPVCWQGKEYGFYTWFPKKIVRVIDDTHIGVPKPFLFQTIKAISERHPFQNVRYMARNHSETLQWIEPTKSEKS